MKPVIYFTTFLVLAGLSLCQPKNSIQQQKPSVPISQQTPPKISKAMCESSIEQGIAGKVIWVEGDRMPSESIDGKPVREEAVGITREIHVYPLTKMTQVQVVEDVFYTNFPTKPIATTLSDKQGCFAIALSAGSYTLVVKEKKGFYGNLFDGEGHIYPITVKPNEATTIRFKVDYMASY